MRSVYGKMIILQEVVNLLFEDSIKIFLQQMAAAVLCLCCI